MRIRNMSLCNDLVGVSGSTRATVKPGADAEVPDDLARLWIARKSAIALDSASDETKDAPAGGKK